MAHKDEALTFSNPRLLSGIYFGLLSILFTFALHIFLSSVLGITQLLPIFQALLLAVPLSVLFGAIFGKRIIYCHHHHLRQAFVWGFIMTLVGLPVYDVGFVYLYGLNHPMTYEHAAWNNILSLYLFVLLDSFILVGIILAILTGLAAMYLRGVLVYHTLRSLND